MSIAVDAAAPRLGAATRNDEAEHDAVLLSASRLSEAALRDASALRHASTTPAAVALVCQGCEALVLGLATWGAAQAASVSGPAGPLGDAVGALIAAVATTTVARLMGAYRVAAVRRFFLGLLRVAAAVVLVALAAGVFAALSADPVVMGVVWAKLSVATVALFVSRMIMAPVVDWCVQAGLTERRAVIVGGGALAERLIRGLEANADGDIRVCALFDDRDDERSPPLVAGARKLGGLAELEAFARIAHIDLVIIALPLSAKDRIKQMLDALWVLPVDIRLSTYADGYAFPRRGRARDAGMIDVVSRPFDGAGRVTKRMIDVGVASLAIVALSPVMLATALAVKLGSRGPVLFKQRRHGYNDHAVEVWKFRSMYVDQADPTARTCVTKDDPRVTRVGRFIRKTSIDELPQFFNVLRGEMSLVGPRPHVINAVSSERTTFCQIVAGYSARHRVKPGITGWAQINGWRGEIDDPEKLRRRFEHDLHYIENWSLWLDLKILALTPIRLLRTENAY